MPAATIGFLFDLDGTLVDSEPATDGAIAAVMERRGVVGATLPPFETRGRTWRDIVSSLARRHGEIADPERLVADLEASWIELTKDAPEIPGAGAALREASEHGAVAVVSSSPRYVIDAFIERLDAGQIVAAEARIGAESVERPKPDPACFVLAARRLGVPRECCVVFEDSRAGLTAARAAGMRTVAILHRAGEPEECRLLADASCKSYLALPPSFWRELAAGRRVLAGESW